jgi:ferredoxin
MTQDHEGFHDELAIISTPVYLGRVPNVAAYRIRRLNADNTPTVLVVSYGNRAYEDAVRELGDIVSEVGFKPIAACAFIGEHSWSMPETPTAHGRPDKKDLADAEAFGKRIREKIDGADNLEDLTPVQTPGVNPYTLRAGVWRPGDLMSPRTDDSLCIRCGKYTEVCPTAAVTLKEVVCTPSPRADLRASYVFTDQDACLLCCACVRVCPNGARIRRPRMLYGTESLSNNYPERKEPEKFL